ncbi:glycosyltransferase [Chlorobium phaeovibrioides]|uniref:glycosyltransferase n=1 Tax=Chlorobium phaeovibrioides TaxID=1094 RepID=UPI00123089A7|nr:glycosyltransferase [Chlorobium phaeovibrioides]QEQ57219.1 glycosyltransferase [Chlorobium phaeovibrioides]
MVFLSRISPKKNLDYLLTVLKKVTMRIELSIYGTLENPEYWSMCERLIHELPSSIVVHYRGEVNPKDVLAAFAQHVFFFPTRGENFGHVIFEALSAGTCVVLSDQTPWKHDQGGAVEAIPLEDENAWVQAVERWAVCSNDELTELRESAFSYARDYVEKSSAVQQNRDLFVFASRQ